MEVGIMLYINCKECPVEEQIQILKSIGVRRTFLSAGNPRIDEVMKTVNDAGMICDNFHGVFNEPDGPKMNDFVHPGENGDIMLERLCKNVLTCSKHNMPILVVHIPIVTEADISDPLTQMRLKKLGDFARENNVSLAFENCGKSLESLKHILRFIPDAKFCYDNAHHLLYDNGVKFLDNFGDILTALHISDNNMIYDDHLIPFEGVIDFENIAKKIADTGYDGTLMLEIMYGKHYPEQMTYLEFATKAKLAGEKIIEMVKKYKN